MEATWEGRGSIGQGDGDGDIDVGGGGAGEGFAVRSRVHCRCVVRVLIVVLWQWSGRWWGRQVHHFPLPSLPPPPSHSRFASSVVHMIFCR